MAALLPGSSRKKEFLKSAAFQRLWRYTSVSVVSTVITLTALYVFYRVAKVGAAWECNVYATAISTVPAYYLNRTWAWGRTGKSHVMREVVPFWVIAFASLLLSTGAVELAAREAHHISPTHEVQTLCVLAANFITYGVIWVGKFLLFNRFLFKPSAHPIDAVSSPAPV